MSPSPWHQKKHDVHQVHCLLEEGPGLLKQLTKHSETINLLPPHGSVIGQTVVPQKRILEHQNKTLEGKMVN